MYSTKTDDGNESYDQQDGPKVIASVQFPIVNGTIVNGTHKIGQKQFSLVNCIPTSWVNIYLFSHSYYNKYIFYFIRLRVQVKIVVNKVVQQEHWN